MTILAAGEMQGDHVYVISVPRESTRCVTDRLTACQAEILTKAATRNSISP